MKKKLLALLAVLLLSTLTACGGSNEDNYKAAEFVEIMSSGTYYLECATYTMGSETGIKMAVDGDNSSVEISGISFPVRVLTWNRTMYYINDEEKKYMALEDDIAPGTIHNGIFDYRDIHFSVTGTGPISDLAGIDDSSYDYEEFTMENEGEAVLVRYYFKGEDLFAIQTKMEYAGSTMVIDKLTKEIPSGLIEMPSGYKMVDAMGFFK